MLLMIVSKAGVLVVEVEVANAVVAMPEVVAGAEVAEAAATALAAEAVLNAAKMATSLANALMPRALAEEWAVIVNVLNVVNKVTFHENAPKVVATNVSVVRKKDTLVGTAPKEEEVLASIAMRKVTCPENAHKKGAGAAEAEAP